MKIAIIGGGASGLFLSTYLKRTNKNVNITIYERNKSLGRKLLATGNGKCNFMNYKATPSDYNNPPFIKKLFSKTSVEDILNYFQELGLSFKFDNEGRMYPITDSSETVLNLLSMDLNNVEIRLNEVVNDLEYKNDKVIINQKDTYDYAAICSGSNASIDIKKRESTYKYLNNLKLEFEPLRPALVGFKLRNNIKDLSGLRMKANVLLVNDEVHSEFGEVIFKEDGINGICIMNLSRYYKSNLQNQLILDLALDNSLLQSINNRMKIKNDPYYYLQGILPNKLLNFFVKNNVIEPNKVINTLKNFKLDILDLYDETFAQVIRGGIKTSELNDDLSLKKYPHIFTTGEVIDIDGKCGGYNLLFAFISALTVGKSLEEKL